MSDYILPVLLSGILVGLLSIVAWKINAHRFGRTELIVRLTLSSLFGWVMMAYCVHLLIQSWDAIANNTFLLILVISGLMSIIPASLYIIHEILPSNDTSLTWGTAVGLSMMWVCLKWWFFFACAIFFVWLVFPWMIYIIGHNFIVGFSVGFTLFYLIVDRILRLFRHR